jgi:hypothetical protein
MKGTIGKIAFVLGIVGALILGVLSGLKLFDPTSIIFSSILIVAGIVIGLLNITDKESIPFMISALVLGVGTASLASLPYIGFFLGAVFETLAKVILPASIVIAIKTAVQMSR